MEWIIAGDAPADRRVLAIKSMETKLVMHWTSGDWSRSLESRFHALGAQSCWKMGSDSMLKALISLIFNASLIFINFLVYRGRLEPVASL